MENQYKRHPMLGYIHSIHDNGGVDEHYIEHVSTGEIFYFDDMHANKAPIRCSNQLETKPDRLQAVRQGAIDAWNCLSI